MREVDFKEWDLNNLDRADTVFYLSSAYNVGSNMFFTNYQKTLQRLSDETLQTILRINTATSKDKTTRTLVKQFVRRSQCESQYVARFAALIEQEYFRVRNTLTATYGITPDNISLAQAFAGVLVIEDATPTLAVPRDQLALILTAIGWLGNVGTLELASGHYETHLWINEDAFHNYLREEHTDEHYDQLLAAICSGQKYTRFLEVIESINGTTKSLVSGSL